MARIASTVLVVALLAATAAAFALTQGLKNQPVGIFGTKVPRTVFSPVCACTTDKATVTFKLREADRLDVAFVDGSDRVVRTIERDRRYAKGPVEIEWDGRDDDGLLLPEGEYKPRIHLRGDRTTYTLPNPIRIDVTPPRLESFALRPKLLSPDGDGRGDRVTFRYRLSEPGRGLLFVDGKRRVRKLFARPEDSIVWNGKVGGRALPPGIHDARLAAVDPAGNVSLRTRPIPVVIRYVALGRKRITVTVGARFALRVSSDARRVTWSLGGRSGLARPGTLRLRAPLQKGRFTLTVSANGHSARAAVFVLEPSR
ncbi:MAG TPA: FlgD immunoglobulin-like domain containing protein, partial [Gaiellaceae bacterium]|nr:FlgD immunoglobulin-like domain containing protein [Gaiellaceae bacterium]